MVGPLLLSFAQIGWAHPLSYILFYAQSTMGPFILFYAQSTMGPFILFYDQSTMGPFILSHALNDGPILLIYILFRLEHMGPFSQ